eukprot:gb/GECH01013042.1/.p1 GENE.gb/GECH01013042.1/~~gb/GECH01013042.1/.p1  ORF type:complete len:1072 (+),score=220.26 gb/GECH01013042.1/:1-3216(+)
MSSLNSVPDKFTLPEIEEEILEHWDKVDAFKTSLKQSEGKKEYTFYDGPPFATGLPHYGHLLAGTIKDIVTRYAHQTGHHVRRRFGWDCHGLPIEFEIEKELGIKTKEEILEMGIGKYNDHCRRIVDKYSSEWEKTVKRMGRWIDFENDYKTMNLSFMESVWWVFRQLFDQGLVYRGFKVMPYSTACTTPLSNFEVSDNYRTVQDPSVIVSFPIVGDEQGAKLVAWTTTPWTLPSNLVLCVNADFTYVRIQDTETENIYIIAESRLSELYPKTKKKPKKEPYKIISKCTGKDLVGLEYEPLFNFFKQFHKSGAFRVFSDDYVTSDSGTGIVHCAPGFGEDDYRVCLEHKVIVKGGDIPCPVDDNGRYTDEVSDWKGQHVKDKETDKAIIRRLKENGRLIHQSTITHNYPFCWRSDTPLIYRAIPSWFIRVEKIKERLVENNKKAYWVPEWVQTRRFNNWLENARDWAVSRNRYWGTPIPIWVSDDYEEVVCVGSVKELEELTGSEVTDLHRDKIDNLTIPSRQGKGKLHRIPEVLDCWFESGSMPYAQSHYPFEEKEEFSNRFPADFIAEGIDQTRGWFYTLLVLGTALFNQCPFNNLIVNGLVLAADGRKMSKRERNYTAPGVLLNERGADVVRLYLINSPVVRGDNLKFSDSGVMDLARELFIPWFNGYRFFVQNARKFATKHGQLLGDNGEGVVSPNLMDRWILSSVQSLIEFVRKEMHAYRLYTVVPRLVRFIDQLTNWYVRMNRFRFKGKKCSSEDWQASLCTLYKVLMLVAQIMAPFTPFITEAMYQNLKQLLPKEKQQDSIHYLMLPEAEKNQVDTKIERVVDRMQRIVEMGRTARDKKGIGLKTPLSRITIVNPNQQYLDDLKEVSNYIKDELNIKQVELTSDESLMEKSVHPDNRGLGQRFKKEFPAIKKAIAAMTTEDIDHLTKEGKITLAGHELSVDDFVINVSFKHESENLVSRSDGNSVVVLNTELTDELVQEGYAREVVSAVQSLRKSSGLKAEDKIHVFYLADEKFDDLVSQHTDDITGTLETTMTRVTETPNPTVGNGSFKVGPHSFDLFLQRRE